MNMTSEHRFDNTVSPVGDVLEAARRYAACALATVPIPYGEKSPRLYGWPRLASKDAGQLQSWFSAGLPSNLGIATGEVSGVFAFDVDVKDGGLETLAELEQQHSKLPATPTQLTPTGGRHYLFALPEGAPIKNSAKTLGAGLDVRGKGGVIVAAPSLHPNGGRYQWGAGLAPWDVPVAEAPAWLIQLIRRGDTPAPKPLGGRRVRPAQIPDGMRNNALFREACRLRGQNFDLEQITALLGIFNRSCEPPCDDAEVAGVAASAMRYDPNEVFPLNDHGNALRFIRDHGERVRFVADRGLWRIWDDTNWVDDLGALGVMRLARETVERMREDAVAVTDLAAAKALKAHARASGDHARLRGMLKVAASEPGIGVASTEFDDLPGKLAVGNGMLDLTTGELSLHDPANLNTRCVPTEYDPSSHAPLFMAAMERVQPKAENCQFLQTFIGQALHGTRPEQLMVWLHGRGGRNGKSFLADLLLLLLPGYAIETSASSFVSDDKRNPNSPRSDLTRLQGSRLVFGQESNDRRRLDSPRIKQLTGDSSFTARANHQDEARIPVTFSLMVLTNPLPNADEADDALWARFVRVPYDVVIPREERIPDYYKVIYEAEAAGVLAWVVQGAISYARDGLTIPTGLIEATADWRRRIGSVERFMKSRTRVSDGGGINLLFLHSNYTKAEQQHHGNPIGVESFRTRLEQLGYAIEDGETGETVLNIRPAPPITIVEAAMGRQAT